MGIPQTTTTVSFRTSKKQELDQIAKALDRDRSYVINEAIDNYLELRRWQLEHIEQGMNDHRDGRAFSTEQVKARIEKLHAKTIKKQSK